MPVGRWNDEDDVYEELESRTTMGLLEELRLIVYEPVCDATEFRRRLGGPPDVIGLEDLARRLRRRAASADLAVSARKAARLSVVAVEFAGGDTSMSLDNVDWDLILKMSNTPRAAAGLALAALFLAWMPRWMAWIRTAAERESSSSSSSSRSSSSGSRRRSSNHGSSS